MKKGLIILLSCVAVGGAVVAALALTEHKHTAGDWVVDQEATCTQEGKRQQVCEKCGETLTEEAIPTKEHLFSSWEVAQVATCTEEEVSERACTSCGLKETSYAPAKGHAYSDEVILQEPDCTEPGRKTFSCSACGLNGAEEAIPALGHVLAHHLPVSADCTNDGIIDHWSCNRCEGLFSDSSGCHELTQADLVVNALGHKAVYHSPVAVTCFTDGSIEHWTCSRCSKYFGNEKCTTEITQASTVIAHGHVSSHIAAKAAECTIDGNIEYWKCSRCSGYFSNSSLTSQITQAQTVLTKLGHSTTHYDAVAENCTTDGNIEYWHCSRCNKNYSDNGYTTEVSSVIIAAHHTGTYTCTICGYHGTYTFGSYPQTQVTNETLIAALNALAGDDPIAGNATSGNWTAYAYYAGDSTEGSEVITYFMYYQDITYQGLKYRGVYITAWKPYFTYYPLNHSYHHQTGYSLNTVYWFKYEPINWVVLSETSTELFLLADKALDSQQAHHAQANNYATSDIWTFINSTFYNTAFSSSEKAKLVTNEDGDKISLLTSEDALNPAYGFDDFTNARDEARKRYGTDYAISQGLYITSTRLCGGWILKTLYPPFWVSGQFGVCSWAGQVANNWAHSSSMGVVPVIIVSR